MGEPIRIGIVDDHPGVRVAVRGLLAHDKDIVVVGEGANGPEAVQLASSQTPDVLLLDVELPVMGGHEVVRRLRELKPEVKVLALSSYNDPMYILGMLENGADGYITKDEAPHLLLVAVRSIVKDKVKWISPKVARQVSQIKLENMTFTGRELEILRCLMLDTPDEGITQTLNIDNKLLEKYLGLLMDKFGVSSREELRVAACRVISTERA
jgi:DNA-binding NarL/FixJ family response regulator